MAHQSKVTEFFSGRKGKGSLHASKRRKVESVSEVDLASQIFVSPPISVRTRARKVATPAAPDLNTPKPSTVDPKSDVIGSNQTKKASGPPKTRRARTKKAIKSKELGSDIREAFARAGKANEDTSEGSSSQESETTDAVPSAFCDDHCASPPSTPTKRRQNLEEEGAISKKRGKGSSQPKDLLLEDSFQTPSKDGFDFEPFSSAEGDSSKVSARKKLVLKRSSPEPAKSPVYEFKGKEGSGSSPRVLSLGGLEEAAESVGNVRVKLNQECPDLKNKEEASSEGGESVTAVNKEPSEVLNKVGKLKAAEVKEHLAKCGKLTDLKAQLAEFSKSKAKLEVNKKKQKDDKNRRLSEEFKVLKNDTKEEEPGERPEPTVPAYQRFHSLASPAPPTLSLPYAFKQLEDTFICSDTILSMLDKRSEVCTFSKLKAAVEQMRKKAFELRHLGQMKRVYPQAYVLRQEKDLPQFNQVKKTAYQLTIEANLTGLNSTSENYMLENSKGNSSKEKPSFSVNALLERKTIFHRNLIAIVKEHHRVFLSKLSRPLTVPDDKVTRWHPRFPLDQVPAIKPEALPEPPDVVKFTTAADVLQHATLMGKVGSRVAKAIETVAAQSSAEKSDKPKDDPPKNSSDLKGIPQALLDRIRAKEKEKEQKMMTRTPAAEKRHAMLSRLPEMARILRTYIELALRSLQNPFFITEKKPALSLDLIVGKIGDSYKSALTSTSVEEHVKLMVEVLPKWLQILTVKRGNFMKMDKNLELSAIINKLDHLIKESK